MQKLFRSCQMPALLRRSSSLVTIYHSLVSKNQIQPNSNQLALFNQLDKFNAFSMADFQTRSNNHSNVLSPFKKLADRLAIMLLHKTQFISNDWRGMYIYGSVGSGKSLAMNLFYENALIPCKLRTHFSAFMLDINGSNQMH